MGTLVQRGVKGANNFCVILSCLDSLRKQGHGMLDMLRQAFHDTPIVPAAKRLNSY